MMPAGFPQGLNSGRAIALKSTGAQFGRSCFLPRKTAGKKRHPEKKRPQALFSIQRYNIR